jgi:hypothetical protein
VRIVRVYDDASLATIIGELRHLRPGRVMIIGSMEGQPMVVKTKPKRTAAKSTPAKRAAAKTTPKHAATMKGEGAAGASPKPASVNKPAGGSTPNSGKRGG